MPIEQLTYAQIAERLGISSEAARAIVKRHRLPRSRSNDGKTLVAVDLEEVRHKPLPARSPRGDQPVTDKVAGLQAKIATLEAELERRAGALGFRTQELGWSPVGLRKRARSGRPTGHRPGPSDRRARGPARSPGRGAGACPTGHLPDMARDVLARAGALASLHRVIKTGRSGS